MNPVMVSSCLYECAGQRWVTPFRMFLPSDQVELLSWQAHYKRLGIQTMVVPKGTEQMLLVNEQDDQKIWPRRYSWK